MWCLDELKTPLSVMETLSSSPPFYIKRYILRCVMLLGQHHNIIQIPIESLPTLKSYSHSQYHSVRNFQSRKMQCFDQALATLPTEDTAICYKVVQHYQALTNKHYDCALQPTLSQLKDFFDQNTSWTTNNPHQQEVWGHQQQHLTTQTKRSDDWAQDNKRKHRDMLSQRGGSKM